MAATSEATIKARDIGELFDPITNRAGLVDVLRKARAEEPVFYSPKFDAWIVTSYKDVKYVLGHPKEFSSVGTLDAAATICPEAERILKEGSIEYPTPRVLANSDAPDHPRVRGPVTRELNPRRYRELESLLRRIANESIDKWIDRGRTDFVTSFAYDFPLTAIMGVLGMPFADLERVKRWGAAWVTLLFDTEATTKGQVENAKSIVAYQRYIQDFIADRRAHPQDDFMSGLVASVYDDGRMTLSELVHLIGLNIIPGAHESTASFLTSALHNLLSRREYWEELCADPALIPNALEEVLRYDGPGVGLYRRTTRDISLGGRNIPADSRVFYCHYSANWDETKFGKPEVFDIHRDNAGANIEFGFGTHYCLGAPLARLEGHVALEILTKRLPSLRLAPDQELEYVRNFILRSLQHLYVEWNERL